MTNATNLDIATATTSSSTSKGRRPLASRARRLPFLSRITVFLFVLLVTLATCRVSRAYTDAFCKAPPRGIVGVKQQNLPQPVSIWDRSSFSSSPLVIGAPLPSSSPCVSIASSSSALGLFRPDWMRRAGRIEEKRKERRDMYESLWKRQDELGIRKDMYKRVGDAKDTKPRKFKVAPPSNNSANNTITKFDYDDGLAIYAYVPENAVEANDESNVVDRLDPGEIIVAKRIKKFPDANAPPPRLAVVAATAIYNVQNSIRTDILWIEHDRGGWSPSFVDGVRRLVPIVEENSDDDGHNPT